MAFIDPFSENFKSNGMYLRVLEMHNGSEVTAKQWWTTPLPYPPFNLRAPIDLMTTEEWEDVRAFVFERNRSSQFDTNVGLREKFYLKSQTHSQAPTGFMDDQRDVDNYSYRGVDLESEMYMRKQRTTAGSISRVVRYKNNLDRHQKNIQRPIDRLSENHSQQPNLVQSKG